MGIVTASKSTKWTAGMVRALPDDGDRYEVIDGELFVTPAPRWPHQVASRRLSRRLSDYTDGHAIGEIIFIPADGE